jgi:hypothetical protein
MFKSATVLLCLLLAAQSRAATSTNFFTASEMQASLISDQEEVRFNGRNYIMGVADTLIMTKSSAICMQDQTEIDQIADLVKMQL